MVAIEIRDVKFFLFGWQQILETGNPALGELQTADMRIEILAVLLDDRSSCYVQDLSKVLAFLKDLLLWLVDLLLELLHVLNGLLELLAVEDLGKLRIVNDSLILPDELDLRLVHCEVVDLLVDFLL